MRALRPSTRDAVEQELRSHRPERFRRLLHHGKEGIEAGGVIDVVEADERNIVGDLEPGLTHGFDRAEGYEVVDGEYRGGRIRELEKASHALETPARVNRYVCDDRRIELDPCVRQGGFVASPPVARSRNFVGFEMKPMRR